MTIDVPEKYCTAIPKVTLKIVPSSNVYKTHQPDGMFIWSFKGWSTIAKSIAHFTHCQYLFQYYTFHLLQKYMHCISLYLCVINLFLLVIVYILHDQFFKKELCIAVWKLKLYSFIMQTWTKHIAYTLIIFLFVYHIGICTELCSLKFQEHVVLSLILIQVLVLIVCSS